jgi:hypothetical protein
MRGGNNAGLLFRQDGDPDLAGGPGRVPTPLAIGIIGSARFKTNALIDRKGTEYVASHHPKT